MSTKSLLLIALCAAGCGADQPNSGAKDGSAAGHDAAIPGDGGAGADLSTSNNSDGGRVPLNHRPDDSQCSGAAPPGNCTLQGGIGNCNKDQDCNAGTNGRCIESNGGAINCHCSYDTCANDDACAQGQTCACHGSPYTGGAGNGCVGGNCRVDGNCPGSYCSPSFDTSSCGALGGYYCHTAKDECVDDGDCMGNVQVCAFSSGAAHWTCQNRQFCP